MDTTFERHTVATAPEASRAALAAAEKRFGYLPAPLAMHAESPTLLAAFAGALAVFEESSLDPIEREVVVMTVAHETGCSYCTAMHTRLLTMRRTGATLIDALRAGTALSDARLEALRVFTRAVMASCGAVDAATRGAFFAAGYSKRQALDVVVGIGTYTLSTYANRLVDAPLDAALEPYRVVGA